MRRLLLAFGILLLALSSHSFAQSTSQAWPTKTIKVVVPLTAGSATDVMARIVFDQVSRQVGQPIVIENRPGAGNSIGMNAVAKADPGKANYSSAGAGNSSHLNGELFRLAGGFEAVHLPFKGAPEAMTEVIAGRSDFYFSPLVNALPLMKEASCRRSP